MEIKDLIDLVWQFIKEPSILIGIALYIVGWLVLKPTKKLPDELIPVVLLVLGILLSFGYYSLGSKQEITEVILQGILACGLATLISQGQIQIAKFKNKE